MVSAHDVAAYVLEKQGPVSAMKLQKLVYYAQAWSLVWQKRPLFGEHIEAWANGPVIPALYSQHRGQFEVGRWPSGDPRKLSATDRTTVESVLRFYGGKSAQWLSDLTHSETPWKQARQGAPDGARSSAEISLASMREYYSTLR